MCAKNSGYIKTPPGLKLKQNHQVLDYLVIIPNPFTPVGQVPIVFLPQGFGRGQLLRLHIQYFILQIVCRN